MEIGITRKLLWGWFCIMLVLTSFVVVSESRILVDRKQNLTTFHQQLIRVNGGTTSTKVIGGKHYMSSKRYIPGGPDPRHH